jgi:hypothetical protein
MSDDHKSIVTVDADIVEHQPLHPLVEAIISRGGSLEDMEKLLEMQERWESRQAERAFTAALVELKSALPSTITYDRKVDFGAKGSRVKYSHLSIAYLLETITPILGEHGFSLTWEVSTPAQSQVTVTARLTHEAGHSVTNTMTAAPDTGPGRNGIQAIGSTTTYLRRYTAMHLLGIAGSDLPDPDAPQVDDDGIDPIRNLQAAARLKRLGIPESEAEQIVGKPTTEWTTADLQQLGEVVKARSEREPGEEE